jgi:hypothetical protein
MEIVKAEDYGLTEDKAVQIQNAFSPMIAEREALTEIYNNLIVGEMSPELIKEARALRLKLVKVRTGTKKIHSAEKSFFLAAGKFVDAWKNKNTVAVELMENKLSEIENYYINIEKEKQAQKRIERLEILELYEIEDIPENLGQMTDSAWFFYEKGIKEDYKQRKQSEKEAEEKRIADEKAEKERIEKIEAENLRLQKEAREKETKRLTELKVIEAEAEKERKKQAEILAKQKAETEKLRKEAEEKAKTERLALEKIEAENQKELQKGDAEKFKSLISDLETLKSKYSFKSEVNKIKMNKTAGLLEKIIGYIS